MAKKVEKPDPARRVTFVPGVDFEGYPFGNKTQFHADARSVPVAESFAELMRDKGLIKTGTQVLPVEDEERGDSQHQSG